jgi:hypothetical protein
MPETLLLIDVQNSEDLVIVQSIWATTADLRAGHRLTRTETVANYPALVKRLAELVAEFFLPAAAVQLEGPVAMAAGPDLAPAAGDGQAKAAPRRKKLPAAA